MWKANSYLSDIFTTFNNKFKSASIYIDKKIGTTQFKKK